MTLLFVMKKEKRVSKFEETFFRIADGKKVARKPSTHTVAVVSRAHWLLWVMFGVPARRDKDNRGGFV